PELLQEDCTPERLAAALAPLLADGPERRRQLEAFARLDGVMEIASARPSRRAAEVGLAAARSGRHARAWPALPCDFAAAVTQGGIAGSSPAMTSELPIVPSRDRQIVAARGAGIELARPPDLLVRILDHLLPLRDPADRAREREQHGEHRGREAHRF